LKKKLIFEYNKLISHSKLEISNVNNKLDKKNILSRNINESRSIELKKNLINMVFFFF